ncbi:carbamoyltransferase [Candidatus Daviesbacteria bacterium]|nr:carbamoyltransferase [Candidatus Daviesbacteria bacterium]
MSKSKYILGINCYFHDSSACILKNGKLIAMAEEERFTRQKHTYAFPVNAINFCLNSAGINLSEVDYIAYCWLPWEFLKMQLLSAIRQLPTSLNLLKKGASYTPLATKLQMANLTRVFRKYFTGKVPPVRYVAHHTAHAYSTYWVSKFNDAAILVVDGFGEDTATTLFKGRGNSITKLTSLPYYDSLGVFYGAITQYLGFRPLNDEYKVMGMAAYGHNRYQKIFEDILKNDGSPFYKLNVDYISLYSQGVGKHFSQKLAKALGPAREYGTKYKQKHFDIACSAQKRLEEIALNLGTYLYDSTGSTNLCIAGGVAQNVLMNTILLEKGKFKKIYVPPVAYDGGCSLGAALTVHHQELGGKREFILDRVDFGPKFTMEECEKALSESGLVADVSNDQSSALAKLLFEGKIIGYFDGGMEIGPRALGHRSILADARRGDIKDILNSRIKKREFFRPFAPMVTYEDANKYFDILDESPFMTIVARVKDPKLLPSITHADGTARIQTVRRNISPHIYSLLKSFEKLSGVPVLLNTSFNENEPIVCTPQEAIDCYLRTKMDVLVFNNRLLVVK